MFFKSFSNDRSDNNEKDVRQEYVNCTLDTRKCKLIIRIMQICLMGRYNSTRKKYYAEITMDKVLRDDEVESKSRKLRYRDKPEESFADFKKHKID